MKRRRPMSPRRRHGTLPPTGRELTAKDVLADLFEEHAFDGEFMADLVIQRLADAGFEIRPAQPS